ncbi:hypothetical protein C0J52_10273 [Blattella germanica]|nr:hypothetical protein C0J52_10273 [Blattella germanica]
MILTFFYTNLYYSKSIIIRDAVHFERLSPGVGLSTSSPTAPSLAPPLEVDMLRCPPIVSYNSDEKPESDEKALLVAAAGKAGPVPIAEDVDVREVSVGGIEGLPNAQWHGVGPAEGVLGACGGERGRVAQEGRVARHGREPALRPVAAAGTTVVRVLVGGRGGVQGHGPDPIAQVLERRLEARQQLPLAASNIRELVHSIKQHRAWPAPGWVARMETDSNDTNYSTVEARFKVFSTRLSEMIQRKIEKKLDQMMCDRNQNPEKELGHQQNEGNLRHLELEKRCTKTCTTGGQGRSFNILEQAVVRLWLSQWFRNTREAKNAGISERHTNPLQECRKNIDNGGMNGRYKANLSLELSDRSNHTAAENYTVIWCPLFGIHYYLHSVGFHRTRENGILQSVPEHGTRFDSLENW